MSILLVTSVGDIVIDLHTDRCPLTCKNFLKLCNGEPTTGKTRPETILRQLNTKKGQVYNMLQAKRDVDTLLAMGIMEDVSIVPQPAGDDKQNKDYNQEHKGR